MPIDRPPPQPLPDRLWGEKWRFVSLPAGEILLEFCDRPIPILELPKPLNPLNLGLASSLPVPGIIIYGGRQSLQLAQWLEAVCPRCLTYTAVEAGRSGGVVLESGVSDRWILLTFDDAEVARAAAQYQKRLELSQGLHFLLVQPDDIGKNYTGFWLLKA